MDVGERRVQVVGRSGNCDRAARCRPAGIGERSNVHAQVVAAEVSGRVATGAARDHLLPERLDRKNPSAEGKRPGDDPTVPVDHLDADLLCTDRRVECSGRRQECRRRGAELCHLDRTLAQRTVERAMEVPSDQDVDAGSDDHEGEQDREERGKDRTSPDRSRDHRWSMNPTPRTVTIIGGPPSERRRYET